MASPAFGVGQQGVPVQQQVVVVEHAGRLLAVDVAVEQPLQLVVPVLAPGKMMPQHVVELLPGVDAPAVDRHAGALLREPLVGLGQVQLGADDVQQVFGVGAVVDGELRRQPDGLAVAVQQPGGDGVEGSAPDARVVPGVAQPAEQVLGPAEHLGGRPAGERQQQDAAGIDALGDQPGHAMHQRGGLAGAGPGHDQQRPFAVGGRLALLRIQTGQQFVDRGVAAHGNVNRLAKL